MTTVAVASHPMFPDDLNTLERCLLYFCFAAKATMGGATFNLDGGANSQQLYIEMNKGYIQTAKEEMMQVILYLPLDPRVDSNELDQDPWDYAKEITNNAFAPGYIRASA